MQARCFSSTGISSLHTRDKSPAPRADTKGSSSLQLCKEFLSPILVAREAASLFFPHPHILCLHRTQQAIATHFSWQLTLLLIKVQKFGFFFLEANPKYLPMTKLPLALGATALQRALLHQTSPHTSGHLLSKVPNKSKPLSSSFVQEN